MLTTAHRLPKKKQELDAWTSNRIYEQSGILAGMLGYTECSALAVACGAYIAGIAGEMAQKEYTDISMTSSDTVKMIPKAVKYIRGEE